MTRAARILVADDEPNFNQIVRAELERRGHQAFAVYDGLEALAFVRSREFDLVLLDVRLPSLEGLEVLRAIRETKPQLPVIMMTAYESVQTRTRAEELGAQAYLVKPFETDALLASVQSVLGAGPPPQPPAELRPAEPFLETFTTGQAFSLTIYSRQHAGTFPVHLHSSMGSTLALTMPIFPGQVPALPLRTPVIIGFGRADGWYEFSASVVGLSPSRERSVLLITRPEKVSRLQRRRQARSPVHFNLSCRLPQEKRGFPATALDLNPEGMRLSTQRALTAGAELQAEGPLGPKGERQRRSAQVVWSTPSEAPPRSCEAGLRFLGEPPPPGD